MFRFDEDLNFSVTPNSLLKDVSPGSSVAVGDVTPGGSVSHIWGMQGRYRRARCHHSRCIQLRNKP